MSDQIDPKAAVDDPAVRVLGDAMWEARRLLGFDTDGDEHPWAAMVGGIEQFAEFFLQDVREMQHELEDLLGELDRLELTPGEHLAHLSQPEPQSSDEGVIVGWGEDTLTGEMYWVKRKPRAKKYVVEFGGGRVLGVSLAEAVKYAQHAELGQKGADKFDTAWKAAHE